MAFAFASNSLAIKSILEIFHMLLAQDHVKHLSIKIKLYSWEIGAIRIFFLPRHAFILHIWNLLHTFQCDSCVSLLTFQNLKQFLRKLLNKVKVVFKHSTWSFIFGVNSVQWEHVKHRSNYPNLLTHFCLALHFVTDFHMECSIGLNWFKTT